MGKIIDLTGNRYGRWLVIELADKTNSNGMLYKCKCDCGMEKNVLGRSLKAGKSKSCGCWQKDLESRYRKHGCYKTPEYSTWQAMKERCYNENNRSYKHYGGKGITVCDRWLESFENFYEDMGKKPFPDHSIDRIDNSGNYEPGNCRWATYIEQNNNTSRTRLFTVNGQEKKIIELAKENGISQALIQHRLLRGKNIETAIKAKKERRGILITVDGITKTVKEFSKQYAISHTIILNRLNRGKSHEDAVKTPLRIRSINQ